MADNFDAAAGQAEQQKRQLLAAIASGGQAAANALVEGQQQVAAMRAAALNNALSTAARRGAPTSTQTAETQTISQPYDRLGAALATSAASRSADFAQMGAAANNYFGQLAAAVPAARAASEREAAVRRQRALDAASAGAADSTPIKDITNSFGGIGNLRRFLTSQSDDYRDIEKGAVNPTTQPQGEGHRSLSDDELVRQGLEVVGQDLGLPPGYSTSLVPPAKAPKSGTRDASIGRKVGLSENSVQKVRGYTAYNKATSVIQAMLDDGNSQAQIRLALQHTSDYKTHPKTIDVAMADAFG